MEVLTIHSEVLRKISHCILEMKTAITKPEDLSTILHKDKVQVPNSKIYSKSKGCQGTIKLAILTTFKRHLGSMASTHMLAATESTTSHEVLIKINENS